MKLTQYDPARTRASVALTLKEITPKPFTINPLMRKSNIIFVFFLFAIFYFGRLKFDLDPVVTLLLKCDF